MAAAAAAGDPRALVPTVVPTPRDCTWTSAYDAVLLRIAHEPPRSKVAGFDLDGTLLRWSVADYPRGLDDYAMWNHDVPAKMQALHADGYKIVLFGNRTGIQGAFSGKRVELCKQFTDWLASAIKVPMHALYATGGKPKVKEAGGYRYIKPEIGMWAAMEEKVNGGLKVDPATSFFVGDAESDREWAVGVGASRGVTMKFQTPEEALGAPAGPVRGGGGGGAAAAAAAASAGAGTEPMPQASQLARAALLGGYLRGPRLIVLCGPQGAGKSHFCRGLLETPAPAPVSTGGPPKPKLATGGGEMVYTISDSEDDEADAMQVEPHSASGDSASGGGSGSGGGSIGGSAAVDDSVSLDDGLGDGLSHASWVVTSQDTATNGGSACRSIAELAAAHASGKPGKREVVEAAAREALRRGECVVVDRMHLDAGQRAHFLKVANECNAPVDAVLLKPPLEVMLQRVRERTGHPGGVQGEAGLSHVRTSYGKIVEPTHAEGFELITKLETPVDVSRLTALYRRVRCARTPAAPVALPPPPLTTSFDLGPGVSPLPAIVLGTMHLKGDKLGAMLRSTGADTAFVGVDTAKTYENETAVGASLRPGVHLTAKVQHHCIRAPAVSSAIEGSLRRLNRPKCELLLLHWPQQAIDEGTLKEVWGAMEAAVSSGQVEALGVCNFTVSALRHLLSFQPAILPRVNQVEVSQIPAAGLPFAHRARTLASLDSHHASLSRPSLRSCATCGLAEPSGYVESRLASAIRSCQIGSCSSFATATASCCKRIHRSQTARSGCCSTRCSVAWLQRAA